MITDEHIKEILIDGNDVDDMANRLVDAALSAGDIDNVSAMVWPQCPNSDVEQSPESLDTRKSASYYTSLSLSEKPQAE